MFFELQQISKNTNQNSQSELKKTGGIPKEATKN